MKLKQGFRHKNTESGRDNQGTSTKSQERIRKPRKTAWFFLIVSNVILARGRHRDGSHEVQARFPTQRHRKRQTASGIRRPRSNVAPMMFILVFLGTKKLPITTKRYNKLQKNNEKATLKI